MSTQSDAPEARGPSHRHAEMGTAAFMVLLGAITIAGSLKVGIGWAAEGPQAGFFPFWIGALIVASSAFNFLRAYAGGGRRLFAEWAQIAQVWKVVWPTAIYVGAVPWIGIYLASALLIAGFMRWLGRYGWALTLGISIGLPIIIYVTFEKWFLVPLPKGPIEDMLGL
ncbi:MAG: tripartite tricarboxylate transporter TctB family protein [Alphaproteobacteria bacterium]|nr:tripartite tricarboxylate transporter TctB family protein [Alphaproteobacteria bacterium]